MTTASEIKADSPGAKRRRGIHPFARATYPGRILILAVGTLMVAGILWERSPTGAVIILALYNLYPHLMYVLARISDRSRRMGEITFFTDAMLVGILVILMQFALVPSLAFAAVSGSVPLLMGGIRLAVWASMPLFVVVAIGLLLVEPEFFGAQQGLPLALAGLMVVSFIFYVSWQVNQLGRGLIEARKSMESSNAKISSQAALMASMNRVAQVVNSTLDLGRVMMAIRESLSDVVQFDQESILFVDREEKALVLKRVVGTNADRLTRQLKDFKVPLDEAGSVFAATARNNRPYLVDDVRGIRYKMSESDARIDEISPVESLMTFPLSINQQVIGVLVFSNTREQIHPSEEDLEVIARHVEFIATAIRNARLYEGVKEARRAADAANQAKSQFLANMSHELRTPMNAVIGYSEMLMEEAQDQGLDDFVPDLERICSASKHLLNLINDVLDLSKIEADKIELYPEPMDAEQFIEDLKSTMRPLVEANGNALLVKRHGELIDIVTDVTRLRQAALNLLSNAAKFTRDGKIRLSMKRYFQDEQWWLDIKVADTGIGMNPEQLKRVFDPFTQADASTTRKYGGTGLGLAISKRFCELMGGTIEVESEEGKGSEFTIRVPARLSSGESPPTSPAARPQPEQQSSGARVLVIDDDASALELMQRLLAREGYEVTTAESGPRGLELARRLKPDVITLDALMPEMDGWTVLASLKNDPELKQIPVVMVTFVDEPRKGFALGAAEYLSKPVDRRQLMQILSRLEAAGSKEALVVEDDQDTRELIASWLQREGWSVRSAVNGREGLEYYRSYRPAVVILDLMMPEVDGFEFLGTLRCDFPDDRTSVIVVTAKELFPEDFRRLNGSVAKVIQKARAPGEQLIEEIARHLPGSRQRATVKED